jgi:hypothetical protein
VPLGDYDPNYNGIENIFLNKGVGIAIQDRALYTEIISEVIPQEELGYRVKEQWENRFINIVRWNFFNFNNQPLEFLQTYYWDDYMDKLVMNVK